jgi:ABC-type bacteriocin/lantibiotic exporter with double-glycine peptidase domain
VSIQARKEYNKEWRKTRKYGHYAVVLKIIKNKVLFMDPGIGKIRSLSVQDFKERWHDADEKTFYRNCAITCLSKN